MLPWRPMARAFYLVFTQMAIGSVWVLPAVRAGELPTGFLTSALVFDLIFAAGAAIGAPSPSAALPWPSLELVALGAFSGLLALACVAQLLGLNARARAYVQMAAPVGLAHVVLSGLATGALLGGPFAPWVPLSFFLSALTLGGALTGMMLGHWYLVQARLPLRPLVWFGRFFAAAMGLSVLVSCALIWRHLSIPGDALLPQLRIQTFADVLCWVKILVGMASTGVVSILAMKSAELGANMSATGLLYLALGQLLASELIARTLLVTRGTLL